jgi:hypothetical protein
MVAVVIAVGILLSVPWYWFVIAALVVSLLALLAAMANIGI